MEKDDITIKIARKTRDMLLKFKKSTGVPIRRIVDDAVLFYLGKSNKEKNHGATRK